MSTASRRTAPGGLRAVSQLVIALLCLTTALMAVPAPAQAGALSMRLSATSGAPGTSLTVSGHGFPRRVSGAVAIGASRVAGFRTTSIGSFSVRVIVPDITPGSVRVSATARRRSQSVAFTVTTQAVAPAVRKTPKPSASPTPSPIASVTPAPNPTATASPTPSPTASTGTASPSPAPVVQPLPTSAPPAGGYFALRPVGAWSSLPSDAEAAALVRRSTWEPRPSNARANATVPTDLALGAHGGVDDIWNSWLIPRISGSFTGTTDEIIQWAALKWGLPDEVLRAQMINESYWYQGLLDSNGQPINGRGYGDYTTDQSQCAPGYTAPCPLSFGVLQIKHASYHPGTFPHSRDSTAFNIDYVAAVMRGCYEGWENWLAPYGGQNGTASNYAAGDLYGCLGRWYSGQWHTTAAENYITGIKNHLTTKPWLSSSF